MNDLTPHQAARRLMDRLTYVGFECEMVLTGDTLMRFRRDSPEWSEMSIRHGEDHTDLSYEGPEKNAATVKGFKKLLVEAREVAERVYPKPHKKRGVLIQGPWGRRSE
jgi:hypothetical protein